jgi:hypothetical protein
MSNKLVDRYLEQKAVEIVSPWQYTFPTVKIGGSCPIERGGQSRLGGVDCPPSVPGAVLVAVTPVVEECKEEVLWSCFVKYHDACHEWLTTRHYDEQQS